MTGMNSMFYLIGVNYLERVRRRGFLLVLLAILLLSLAIATGRLILRLDTYIGVYNSTWVGTLVAGSTTVLLSLANFFIIKNAIDLDRRTGVGQLIASTPVGKFEYLTGKCLSNFAVLITIEIILFVSAIGVQLVQGDSNIDLLVLLYPFIFIAFPAMAAISALAVLFEVIPGLRSGLGNGVYIFLWFIMLFRIAAYRELVFDLPGILYVDSVFTNAAKTINLPFEGGFSVEGGLFADPFAQTVLWEHVAWVNDLVIWRLYWFGIAIVLVIASALLFDRFDSNRREVRLYRLFSSKFLSGWKDRLKQLLPGKPGQKRHADLTARQINITTPSTNAVRTTNLRTYLMILWLELRMIWKQRWWWYLVMLGLFINSLVAPIQSARTQWIPLIWLWLGLAISRLGLRESIHHTEQLIFSTPRPLWIQFSSAWLAGVLLTIITGIGSIRLVSVGEWKAALALGVAAFFIPTLALGCAILCGNQRLFEVIYITLWFLGPMGSKGTGLDFMGVHPEVVTQGIHWRYLGLTILMLILAFIGRQRQLRSL
jgi:hypothetical protein